MPAVKSNSVICSMGGFSHSNSGSSACEQFFVKLPVPQWKPTRVRFCPFAVSVTVPLMVFAFMASFHLPLLPCSHTLCQARQHVTFTEAREKDSGLHIVSGFSILKTNLSHEALA